MTAIVISITNHKGGTGKTTTTVNLADALAREGMKVLVVDMDPQSNASTTIGKDSPYKVKNNVAEMLFGDVSGSSIAAAVHSDNRIPGVDLIYSSIKLASLDEKLRTKSFNPAKVLDNKLSVFRDHYDYILIDCPPSLSLLPANALAASDYYLVPLESGSQFGLDGIEDLQDFIGRIKEVNPRLKEVGVVLTKHDGRKTVCQIMAKIVSERFPNVFKTTISGSTKISQAIMARESVIQLDRKSRVSREYVALAREIMERTDREPLVPRVPEDELPTADEEDSK